MRTVKLWIAVLLLAWSRRFHTWASGMARRVSALYGVQDIAEESGLPPDDKIYFLLKRSNGMYNFHGIVAENRDDARKQAWKIPGSLLVLDSMDEFRAKLLSEANQRPHA